MTLTHHASERLKIIHHCADALQKANLQALVKTSEILCFTNRTADPLRELRDLGSAGGGG
jgi:hypothetical protein